MSDEPKRWGPTEMIITVLSVLAGVSLGAWIVWSVISNKRAGAGLAAPDLSAQVSQIRGLIRAANRGDSSAAAQAQALLDDLESTYGVEAVSRACNPNKLRGLIKKVQSRALAA